VTGGVRRRPLALLCLAVLAGCGVGHTTVKIPDGFTVRTIHKPVLSIALPNRWRSFGDSSHTSAQSIAGGNQRLRVELETLAESDSPIKLIGVDPVSAVHSATNMNVLQTRVPSSLSFEEMARIEATQIRRASGISRIEQEKTELPAGRALHLTYHPRATALVQQYFVRHGDFLYVLTYSTPSADGAKYAAIFDQSAHTFQVG
jgi:hypothetical protein